MHTNQAQLEVARAMCDYARQLRCLAADHTIAEAALAEEKHFDQRVRELEKEASQPELALETAHSHAA